jgi:hypothetical protein
MTLNVADGLSSTVTGFVSCMCQYDMLTSGSMVFGMTVTCGTWTAGLQEQAGIGLFVHL